MPPCLPYRSGFSFAEVMFAVVVLGIGFIMVAAIFPVAIKQTQSSAEESFSAAVSRNGVSYFERMGSLTVPCNDTTINTNPNINPFIAYRPSIPILAATDLLMPVRSSPNAAFNRPPRTLAAADPNDITTPGLIAPGAYRARGKLLALGDWRLYDGDGSRDPDFSYPLRAAQLREGYGSAIVPTDTRFAYVPLYRRDRSYSTKESSGGAYVSIDDPLFKPEDSPVAQVVVFGVQIRNRTNFDQRDLPQVQAHQPAPIVPVRLSNLQPRPVAVRVVPETFFNASGSPSTYVAQFFSVKLLDGENPRGGFPRNALIDKVLDAAPAAIAEGCYFVISDDRIVNNPADDELSASVAGLLNGRIFRIGTQRTELGENVWDLYPGFEFAPDAGANGVFDSMATLNDRRDDLIAIGVSSENVVTTINNQSVASNVKVDGGPPITASNINTSFAQGAIAFVMGRSLSDDYIADTTSNPPAPTFDGTAMDVSIYTTVIKVK